MRLPTSLESLCYGNCESYRIEHNLSCSLCLTRTFPGSVLVVSCQWCAEPVLLLVMCTYWDAFADVILCYGDIHAELAISELIAALHQVISRKCLGSFLSPICKECVVSDLYILRCFCSHR